MLLTILRISQLVFAILFVASVLLQARGSGLGAVFGGGEGNVYRTKRGVEKTLFQSSIVLAILFFGASIAQVIL
jgi:preprotein translocase subunit SecG